ncbi:putative phage tail protein [Candidatus Agathobaculum pullicola]|uniref:putative phage tail protein n=1 Tax=Candidatus Agathobaculum pullicola TaxID=2838426 RepID=UPI003F8E74EE
MRYRTELMDSILTSENARRFIDFIAPVYGNGYVALWMFQAIGLSLDELTQAASGLGSQTVPQTADWSIPDWEFEYGISPDPSLTDEQRRANIIMRMNFVAPANPARLEQIASASSGVPCNIVENISKNTFAILMRELGGDISNMKEVLDSAKPAHLIYVTRVALLRETESSVYMGVAGSYHKKYQTIEVNQ